MTVSDVQCMHSVDADGTRTKAFLTERSYFVLDPCECSQLAGTCVYAVIVHTSTGILITRAKGSTPRAFALSTLPFDETYAKPIDSVPNAVVASSLILESRTW
jgi:hypothetical protein